MHVTPRQRPPRHSSSRVVSHASIADHDCHPNLRAKQLILPPNRTHPVPLTLVYNGTPSDTNTSLRRGTSRLNADSRVNTAPPSLYIQWNSESMLLVLWRQRCVQAGHWTVHTQLIFLHDQKMFEVHFHDNIGHCCAAPFCAVAPAPRPASASPAPRGGTGCSFQPCNSESERQRSRSAPCEGTRDSPTHRCHILAVAGSRTAEHSTRRCLSGSRSFAPPRAELQLSSKFVS